jgi:hypothetical protein
VRRSPRPFAVEGHGASHSDDEDLVLALHLVTDWKYVVPPDEQLPLPPDVRPSDATPPA